MLPGIFPSEMRTSSEDLLGKTMAETSDEKNSRMGAVMPILT